MAKFVSLTFESFERLLAKAKKNGFLSVAERIEQDTAPSWMQTGEWVQGRHKIPKRFQRELDKNKGQTGKNRLILPRSDFKNLMEAAGAKTPLKNPELGGRIDSGIEISRARKRKPGISLGKPQSVTGFKDPVRPATRTPSGKTPSKKMTKPDREMDLADRRRELRRRAQEKNPIDILDYLLSKGQ